jgi:hypothetical protein
MMLRELDVEECDASGYNQGIKAGLIKILLPSSKILILKPEICNPTPTFAVLSQTVGSGVPPGVLVKPVSPRAF